MVSEAHVKLRKTGSGKAGQPLSGGSKKLVHSVVATSGCEEKCGSDTVSKGLWKRRSSYISAAPGILAALGVLLMLVVTLQLAILLNLQPVAFPESGPVAAREPANSASFPDAAPQSAFYDPHPDVTPQASSHNDTRTRGISRGVFPAGCRWRTVKQSGAPAFWAVEEYEWWNDRAQRWVAEQPAACLLPGKLQPAGAWGGASPRTEVVCTETHCIYERLWYNNGRFYLLVDGETAVAGWKMSRNLELNVLHVDDAAAWADNVAWRPISGDSLVFDYVYFLHPTAIGHWGEMMFPLFSILRREPAFAQTPSQFVLLHLKRAHLMEWVRSIIAAALGVARGADLPRLLMQQESHSVWNQTSVPLEGLGAGEWACFERALVVRDIFTGGVRTFLSRNDAQAFRSQIYSQHGLPEPQPGPPPRVITYQRKRANRRIINEEAFIRLLREFGEVRIVEFSEATPFAEQLAAMAATGVLVSVHTSNLANAHFLPPGRAVIELIQKNWVWQNLDRSFQVQTEMMGDIHHFAWRARHRNQTVYLDKRDAQRFGDWDSQDCDTEECVEAHTNVDVVVDLAQFRALLDSRLPLVFAGAPVAAAALPWPEVSAESTDEEP